ncbi:MAG TPA: alpha/beta hydrolase-fold protein [Solirubrobacteraceae bacterium]|jgi:enterochelin esterase-like enzyme|nr:alpha/beta hydrolase-fold protein [Solirubrobacteraceae bacterium]
MNGPDPTPRRPGPRGRRLSPSARRSRLRRRRLFALTAVAATVVIVAALAFTLLAGANTHGALVVRYAIDSRLVHHSLPQVGVIPPGHGPAGRKRPLLVFLHGKGEEEESNLNSQMYAALARLGQRAPDVVFPNGGEDSYWHNRASGDWGSYVIDEVIPQALRRLNADPRRVAIAGISMGGFGAYDIARRSPSRFCAVGGHSAALWATGGETAPGAFDDAEDFARHDVIAEAEAAQSPYAGKALWLDVGTDDPFRTADTRLAHALREKGETVSFHVWPGAHEGSYWRSHWNEYLRFYAAALERC